MAATTEQVNAIKEIQKESCNLLKISACSGSGKTWTLVELVKELNPSNGLYIAYNKAIATEAATKFPSTVQCKTTHSLAYRNTVIPYHLKVGYFGYRDITSKKLSYNSKLELIESIDSFCLSASTSYTDYIRSSDYPSVFAKYGEDILQKMSIGTLTCTHAFYLKLYHILLVNKDVVHDEFDVLLLDEAGDLNEVTLSIFLELPAKKKVMVGDPNQNIYSFNNTINGFETLSNIGTSLGLTKSFRVDTEIAMQMEAFARDTFDPTMVFKGTTHTDKTITSSAFISRTNGALIAKMFKLQATNTPYNLVRPVKAIFALPMTLIGLKQGGFITDPQYKFLQEDVNDYYRSRRLQRMYDSHLKYIIALHGENPGVKTAINIITTHGAGDLISIKNEALAYERDKTTYPMTICTSHSSKGLEFDEVEIGDDTNMVLKKILSKPPAVWTPNDYEEMRLFYVAATRARKELINAVHLYKYAAETLGFNV